ncbi:MAG: Ig-like domain-containing protein, partial [Peptococcales bacterium]
MFIKKISISLVFLLMLQCFAFPLTGQAQPHLVNVYINQELAYSPSPVYLTASALYSDGSIKDVTYSGTWNSDRPSIATVYRGKVEFGRNIGNVTITFSYGGIEASVGTEVVDITDLQIITRNIKYSNKPVQLKAQGRYNNGELREIKEHIRWYSTNEEVAIVDSNGLVTFRGNAGVTRIGIIFTSPLTGKETYNEVEVTVTEAEIEKDEEPRETKAFTVKIDGKLDPTKKSSSLKAYRLYIDDTKKTLDNDLITWSSSNPNVAEVNEKGQVTFTGKPGNVTITVRYRNYSDSISTFVPYKTLEMFINESLNFTPYFFTNPPKLSVTGRDNSSQNQLIHNLEWSSSNLNVANIDHNGQITFTGKPGTVTFTATKDGLSTSITVTVPELPDKNVKRIFINPSLFYSTAPVELKAFALMGDNTITEVTKDCRWASSNETVATVRDGFVYFTGRPGAVDIICTYQGFSDRDKIIVYAPSKSKTLSAIKFTDHFFTYGDHGKVIEVLGIYSDNSKKPLESAKLTSFEPNIIKIQNNKLYFSGMPGIANIEAQAGKFRTIVQGETVNPAGNNIPVYLRLLGELDSYQRIKELKALAVYSNGTSVDVTNEVVWNTTNSNIAQLQEKGRIEMIGTGPVRISASYKNLNTFLSNKAYYQFNQINPMKIGIVPLADIKLRVREKLSQNILLPLPSDIINHWARKELEMARKLSW